ncbi:hypothetical protein Pint_28879 [Pistacia integerrima]|uniref:Uncharacterized protein n=1 Tax=Pistacia integerrima TaxID=434235 RepID=A0ACC0X0S3_9ROSI|nr:hypothetical protein Pint_28879 [Pistacia integerrima]
MSVKKTLPVDNNNIEAVKKSLSLKERSCWWQKIKRWAKAVVAYARQVSGKFGTSDKNQY